jgi:probable phosphoglycerate mutase
MRLYVVRHGETLENATGIIQGHDPGALTLLGIEQAKLLALRLKDLKFDAIYTSDLGRASDTTRHIAQFHDAPIHHTDLLRERGAGIFQGGPKEKLYEAENSSGLPLIEYVPPGGESFKDLHKRASLFLSKLLSLYSKETLLLVAHGGWNRMLLGIALDKSIEEALTIPQSNTCVNIIDCEDSNFRVRLMNCSKHL